MTKYEEALKVMKQQREEAGQAFLGVVQYMKANIGDYVITGINGEQYPCKPDIFEKTYELVGEEE